MKKFLTTFSRALGIGFLVIIIRYIFSKVFVFHFISENPYLGTLLKLFIIAFMIACGQIFIRNFNLMINKIMDSLYDK